jgi:hypothetical protein
VTVFLIRRQRKLARKERSAKPSCKLATAAHL